MTKLRVAGWRLQPVARRTRCPAKVSGKKQVVSEVLDLMERAMGLEPTTLSLGS
jgi:hypothetical protein